MRKGVNEQSDDRLVDPDRRRSARLCKLLLAGLEDGVVEEKVAAMRAWENDEYGAARGEAARDAA